MARIKFANGKTVNFQGNPTQEDIDEVADSLGFNSPSIPSLDVPTKPPEKPTAIGKGVDIMERMVTAPMTSPPSQFLERKGQQVKSAAQGAISNLMTRPHSGKVPDVARAAVGTAASTLVDVAPFTPSELAIAIGSEFAPGLLPRRGKNIANRYVNAPKDIREGRFVKDETTVGEELLQRPKYISQDKKKVFKGIRKDVVDLSKSVKSKIESIYRGGKSEAENMSPFNAPRNEPFIRTKEIADSIDPIIKQARDDFGATSNEYKRLIDLKNDWLSGKPDTIDIRRANELRESLGDTIGKRFNKEVDELPEVMQARRDMWVTLRRKIGEFSPEVDSALKEQHSLLDIMNSVKGEAAKGYYNFPNNAAEFLLSPISKNIRLAKNMYHAPGTRGVGGVVSGLSNAMKKKDKP